MPVTTFRWPRLRGVALLAAVAAATSAVFLAWMAWSWGGERLSLVVDDLMQIVAPAAAAAACAVAARRAAGHERFAWWTLAASCVSWGMGSAVWAYEEVLRGTDPFPSLADAGYLLAVPLAAVALLVLRGTTRRTVTRILLDGGIVAAALLCVSWAFVLGPLFRQHDVPLLEQAISLAYPISDVVLFTLALSLLGRAQGSRRLSVALLVGGILQLSLADSVFTFLTTTGAYGPVNLVDTLWVSGYLSIGLAAVVPPSAARRRIDGRIGTAIAFLPYAVLVLAAGIIAALELRHRGSGLDTVVLWVGGGAVVLLLLRQAMVLWENLDLTTRLEQRVQERTAELVASRRKFEALVMHSAESISVIDAAATVVYQSRAVNAVLGYSREAVVDHRLADVVHPGDRSRLDAVVADLMSRPGETRDCELRVRHADRSWRICEARLTNLLDDADVRGVVVNLRDITARKQLEQRLQHDALHDRLTGLPNRALFRDRLEQALARHRRWQTRTAVLFVDLDGFKGVNDALGHDGGDAVLVSVARRLSECTRTADTVARLGGDEFGVIVQSGSDDDVLDVATRIRDALDGRPVTLDGRDVFVGASIGIAYAAAADADPDRLVRDADVAMYVAKSKGRNRIEVYDDALHAEVMSAIELETDLRHCVQRGELRLEFQPLVALSDGHPVGFEALVRWAHPRRGLVRPDVFIPIAERTGAIADIGRWVLGEACSAAREWRDAGAEELWISVNVSALQLREPGFVEDVEMALAATGLPAEALIVELTESVLAGDTRAVVESLETLRALGVRVAVDDFGTGYSSLNYLQSFPFDLLKVDRAFVDGSGENGGLSLLARTILDLCHNMHVAAIAEGIEHPEQAASLAAAGCEYGQGYHFARPMPQARALAYVRESMDAAATVVNLAG